MTWQAHRAARERFISVTDSWILRQERQLLPWTQQSRSCKNSSRIWPQGKSRTITRTRTKNWYVSISPFYTICQGMGEQISAACIEHDSCRSHNASGRMWWFHLMQRCLETRSDVWRLLNIAFEWTARHGMLSYVPATNVVNKNMPHCVAARTDRMPDERFTPSFSSQVSHVAHLTIASCLRLTLRGCGVCKRSGRLTRDSKTIACAEIGGYGREQSRNE